MRIFLVLALWAVPAAAQLPDASGKDTLSIWVVQGNDTLPMGRLIDSITVQRNRGVPLVHRVLWTDAPIFGPRVDTVVSRLDTGALLRYVGVTPRGTDRVDVVNGRATGTASGPGGTSVVIDLSLPDSTVLATNLDLVLRSRLLYVGDIVAVRLFVPPLLSIGVAEMRVEAEPVIDGERTWRLAATNLDNKVTYWISQRSRLLLRQTMLGPNGALLLLDRRPIPSPQPRPLPRP